MRILSIDIGIKNLAHCFLETSDTIKILDWNVVDLTGIPKCVKCIKAACYKTSQACFCKKHVPVFPKMQGLSKQALTDLCSSNQLELGNRAEMAARVALLKKRELIQKGSLVDLGRALCAAYDNVKDVDVVLIENQMAARMAVVMGLVVQYWIMRGVRKVEIVSPVQKLKFIGAGKTVYAERKKMAVEHTRRLLLELNLSVEAFESHRKKDDLADTFLQAMWYVRS